MNSAAALPLVPPGGSCLSLPPRTDGSSLCSAATPAVGAGFLAPSPSLGGLPATIAHGSSAAFSAAATPPASMKDSIPLSSFPIQSPRFSDTTASSGDLLPTRVSESAALDFLGRAAPAKIGLPGCPTISSNFAPVPPRGFKSDGISYVAADVGCNSAVNFGMGEISGVSEAAALTGVAPPALNSWAIITNALGVVSNVAAPTTSSTTGAVADDAAARRAAVGLDAHQHAEGLLAAGRKAGHAMDAAASSINAKDTAAARPRPGVVAAARPRPGAAAKGRPSFADITARRAAKPPDLLAYCYSAVQPIQTDDGLVVVMPAALYEQRLRRFQFALIGRLVLPQGGTPRPLDDFKGELTQLFGTTGDWSLVPLGKGFFSLKFSNREDQVRASCVTSWKLQSGHLHNDSGMGSSLSSSGGILGS